MRVEVAGQKFSVEWEYERVGGAPPRTEVLQDGPRTFCIIRDETSPSPGDATPAPLARAQARRHVKDTPNREVARKHSLRGALTQLAICNPQLWIGPGDPPTRDEARANRAVFWQAYFSRKPIYPSIQETVIDLARIGSLLLTVQAHSESLGYWRAAVGRLADALNRLGYEGYVPPEEICRIVSLLPKGELRPVASPAALR